MHHSHAIALALLYACVVCHLDQIEGSPHLGSAAKFDDQGAPEIHHHGGTKKGMKDLDSMFGT